MATRILALFVALVACDASSRADDTWNGKTVLTKQESPLFKADAESKEFRHSSTTQLLDYVVRKETRDYILVAQGSDLCWLRKADVVALKDAEDYFTKIVRRQPDNSEASSRRGVTRKLLHDYDNALTDFDNAIRVEPSNAAHWNNRSNLYREMRQYGKALSDANESVRLEPNNSYYLCGRASSIGLNGDPNTAVREYDKLIESNPRFPLAYNGRGWAWFVLGRPDKSAADFDKAIELDSGFAFAYCNRSFVWMGRREFAKAVEDLRHAVRSDPGSALAHKNLAALLATCPVDDVRNGKQAVELAQKAMDLTKGRDPTMLIVLAAAFAESGRFDEAVKWQQKAIEGGGYSKEIADIGNGILEEYRAKRPRRIK